MRPGRPPRQWIPRILLATAAVVACGCRVTPPARAPVEPRPVASSDPRIETLATGDFAARSRAAEALLAQGDTAIGTVGEARDRWSGSTPVVVARLDAVLSEALRTAPADRLVAAHMVARSPSVRRAATDEAARRSQWDAMPAIVARLEDEDVEVRASAVAAIRKLTDRLYDVSPRPTRAEAADAAARTRDWWSREGSLARASRRSGG